MGRRFTTMKDARRATPEYCPVSAGRSHDEGSRRDGRCTWCQYRFRAPAPMPSLSRVRTVADLAYRRFYDPDWGTDVRDVDA